MATNAKPSKPTKSAEVPTKRRCPWCDTFVDIDVAFCPECGEQLIKKAKKPATPVDKKKKGRSQTALGVFLVIIGFFIFIGIAAGTSSGSGKKKSSSEDKSSSAEEATTSDDLSIDVSTSGSDSYIDVTQQKLTDIFNAMDINDSDLQIFMDDQEVWRVIYTDNKTYWDATEGMSHYLSDYVNFCTKAMKIENVEAVQFFIFVTFLDADNNSITEKAVVANVPKYNIMNEDDWSRYNLGGLYWFIEDSAEVFDVHAALKKEIVEKDVRYVVEY